MTRFGSAILLTSLWCILTASGARASQPGEVTLKNWKAMDQCARQAQIAFPDYTAESNAKRDAKLKECLQARNMPGREPLSSPSPR